MKKKKLILLFAVIFCVGAVVVGVLLNANKVIYGLSEGTYTAGNVESIRTPASITFDFEKSTFTFCYDLLSSYLPQGTWEIEKGKVIATTDDKNHVYIFDIVDHDTIAFVQKGSSILTYIDDKITTHPKIVDGTKFIFSDP